MADVKIALNDYQRANLVALLDVVRHHLPSLNTGDWVEQVYWKLFGDRSQGEAPSLASPNLSPSEQFAWVQTGDLVRADHQLARAERGGETR